MPHTDPTAIEVTASLAGLAVLLAGPLLVAVLSLRDRLRALHEPTWDSPIAEMTPTEPLDMSVPVAGADLAPASLFEELVAATSVRLEWAPPSFTAEWESLGQQLRELGDTQVLEAVPA